MARVKMAVDEWLKTQKDSDIDDSERELITSAAHWTLGSPDRLVSVGRVEAEKRGNLCFRNFNMRLREYIACYHPSVSVRLEQEIKLFTLIINPRNAHDILRCNPNFHNAPRFDSVIYETDDDLLAMGQLQFVFRTHLPSGAKLDLAMIRQFRKTSWQPRTRTPTAQFGRNSQRSRPCSSRWNTLYACLEAVAEWLATACKPSQGPKLIQAVASNLAFFRHVKTEKLQSLLLSESEWARVKTFVGLLGYAYAAQQAFSCDVGPSMRLAIPAMESLHRG
ncbi:hypothetical protein B0H13DRAFT_2263411 [Mycena leptocephala]|nr:hypothetical protein B0H13DRAFT_2263411 [Mycena leptocephala]